MKIAVYTIAKNEEQFAERWVKSCAGADYLVVGDTGSSDNTVDALRKLGVKVIDAKIDQFRFDTTKQMTLDAIPSDADVCIQMDMDEVLSDGWRAELEKVYNPQTSRYGYKFISTVGATSKDDVWFYNNKIHNRHAYKWKYPCHEVLSYVGPNTESAVFCHLIMKHYPDVTKSRGSYMSLLKIGAQEYPDDLWALEYYARELVFYKQYNDAIKVLEKAVSIPTANLKNRAASYHMLAVCYRSINNYDLEINSLKLGMSTLPDANICAKLSRALRENFDYQESAMFGILSEGIKDEHILYVDRIGHGAGYEQACLSHMMLNNMDSAKHFATTAASVNQSKSYLLGFFR